MQSLNELRFRVESVRVCDRVSVCHRDQEAARGRKTGLKIVHLGATPR